MGVVRANVTGRVLLVLTLVAALSACTTHHTASVRVHGTMEMVGGPPGAANTPVSGAVTATDASGRHVRGVSRDGVFVMDLPPGDFTFVGRSPQWNSGAPCPTVGPVRVEPGNGNRGSVSIVCPRK